jgi:hypothetical protein
MLLPVAGAVGTSRANADVERVDVRRPAAHGDATCEIREACARAAADGVRLHMPSGVGILVIGIPTCALAAFAHFVLGVSPSVTSAAGGAGTIAYVLRQIFHSI